MYTTINIFQLGAKWKSLKRSAKGLLRIANELMDLLAIPNKSFVFACHYSTFSFCFGTNSIKIFVNEFLH